MKKNIFFIILSIFIVITIVIAVFEAIDFLGLNYYSLPSDRYATQQEVEEYVRRNIGLNDFEFISSEGEGKYEKHYWTFREKNERGIVFKVGEVYSPVNWISIEHYENDCNYDIEVLKDYISNHRIPCNGYFSTEEGAYASSEVTFFGRKGGIVVHYRDDNLKQITKELQTYIQEFYEYNKSITDSNRNPRVPIIFKKENSKYSTNIYIGYTIELSELTTKGVRRIINFEKKYIENEK